MGGKDDKKARGQDDAPPSIVKTAGEPAAAAFVEAEVPEEPVHPTMEMDRVQVLDPRRAPTMRRIDILKGSGPRDPDQMKLPQPKGPVEAPMERPATKMQPIRIDPEFLAELSVKAAEKAARPSNPDAAARVSSPDEVTLERTTQPMQKPAPAAVTPVAVDEEDQPKSPWVNEAAAPIAAMELPSALAPVSSPEPAPVSEKAAGEPPSGSRTLRVMIALAVIALLGFAAFQLMPKTRAPDRAAAVPAPSATATGSPEPEKSGASAPPPVPSVPAAPPAVTGEPDGGLNVAPPTPPQGTAPKKARPAGEDPYDAAPPPPVKTAETQAPPPPTPPAVTVAPSVSSSPAAPPSSPSAKPIF
jgi:hypothetical protein